MKIIFKSLALASLIAASPMLPVAAAPASQLPAQAQPAACNTAFFVTNETSGTILLINARRLGSQEWGPDLLGADKVLPAGASTALMLPSPGQFELKATGLGGQTFHGRVSACDVLRVAIR